jgi:hypothetical protein
MWKSKWGLLDEAAGSQPWGQVRDRWSWGQRTMGTGERRVVLGAGERQMILVAESPGDR